jgi:flagellar hook-associated protein 2
LNGRTFTVDPGKDTLDSILDKINRDAAIGINAFYDKFQDKVVLTTKATGTSA